MRLPKKESVVIFITIVVVQLYSSGYILNNTTVAISNLHKSSPGKVAISIVSRSRDEPSMDHKRLLDARSTRWTSDIAFHRYLSSHDVSCNRSFRAGKIGDGGWDICISEPFHLKPPCLVYSFGINYDFSFDDAIAQHFKCEVKAFDPSMKRVKGYRRGKYINFFKEGISGRDFKTKNGWKLYSLATILKRQNDTNKIIDYFKMDVERSEWDALPDMAVKSTLGNIKQIAIEIHRDKGDTKSAQLINILEDNGFRKWKMDYNTKCSTCSYKLADGNMTSTCIELYYINTHFIDHRQRKFFMRK